MSEAQIIEGTVEEVTNRLRQSFASDERVRIFVEPETPGDADTELPPFVVRDKEHLLRLLAEGLQSPTHPVTDATWEYVRNEVRRRHEARVGGQPR